MRYLFVSIEAELNQQCIQDLQTNYFADVIFINYEEISKPHTSQFENICRYLTSYKTQGELFLRLPESPIVVLLYNYTDVTNYKAKILHISQKQENTLSNDFILTAYHDYVDPIPVTQKQPPKKVETVPTIYSLNDQQVICPLLVTITQQLMQDFIVRQLYMQNIKDSGVINISGKSILLQAYPDFYTTINDSYLQKIYDVNKQKDQMISYYGQLIDDIPSTEQNSIAIVLGCMIDAVQVVTEKQEIIPDEYIQSIIQPSSEFINSELTQMDFQLPSIRTHQYLSNPATDFSIFDTFDHTIYCKLTSVQSRYYTKMAFDAYLSYYNLVDQVSNQQIPNKDPGRQTPRTVMLRRADFAELIGMFMKDCGGDQIGLLEAESVIRKTLLMHLDNIDAGDYYVNLTDPISSDIAPDLSVIKLGARKSPEYNQIPVHAQISLSQDVPCHQHQHFDSMGNNLCFVQDPILPGKDDLGIVKTGNNKQQMQFFIQNSIEKLIKTLKLDFKRENFLNLAPNLDEFYEQLSMIQLIQFKESAQDAKKKTEQIPELSFESELIQEDMKQEFIEQLLPVNEKDKKGAVQRKIVGSPFQNAVKGQIYSFIQLIIHSWYSNSMKNLPVLCNQEEKIIIDQLDAPSVEREDTQDQTVSQHIYQNVREIFSKEDKSIYSLFNVVDSIEFVPVSKIDLTQVVSKDKKAKAGEAPTSKIQVEQFNQAYPLVLQCLFLALNMGDEKAFFILEKSIESIELSYQPIYFFSKSANTNYLNKKCEKHLITELILQLVQNQSQVQNQKQLNIEKIGNNKLYAPYRDYQDFSIPVGDRSVINAFPIQNKIQVVRKWNALQQQIVNYSGPQQFTDKFTFSSASVQKYITIEQENITFTNEVPITAHLHGELQDESNIRCFDDCMVFEKDSVSQKFSLLDDMELGKTFDFQAKNIPIVCQMINKTPKSLKCLFKKDNEFICIQDGEQLISIQDIFETNLLEQSTIHPKLVFSSSQTQFKFLDQITGMAFEQFGFLSSIKKNIEDQTSQEIKVIQTFYVPQLLTVSQLAFDQGVMKDSFLLLDTKCTIFEIPTLERIVFVFNNSKVIISVSLSGDIFIQLDRVTYALKQDGSFYILLSVQTQSNNFYRKYNEVNAVQAQPDLKGAKKSKTPGDVSQTTDPSIEESKIYQSPLILYGGQGFHFWHSILERRTRFLRNVDLTTRITFEKQALILKNPELTQKYENLEPIELLFQIVKLCQTEYKDLIHCSTNLQQILQKAAINFNRIHHEMFLPISDTYQSKLTGVYRFILGSHDSLSDSPLYPSVSTIDWVGNTYHLRLGSSFENTFDLQKGTSRANTPKQVSRPSSTSVAKIKNSKDVKPVPQQGQEAPSMIYAWDNVHPVFPPLLTETIQTDIIGELMNLVKKRETDAIEKAQQQLQKDQEAARPPTPDDKKGKKQPQKPAKNKKDIQEEEIPQQEVPQLRKLTEIINELEHIEIDTIQNTFKKYLLLLSGSTEQVLLGKRGEAYNYQSQQLEEFITASIPNALIPSPAQLILQKRYIILPMSPDQKYFKGSQSFDFSDQAFCTIDNDLPWIVVDNKDISQLVFFSQMLEFADITNFSLIQHKFITRISTNLNFSLLSGLGFQPAIKFSLLNQINQVRQNLSNLSLNNDQENSNYINYCKQFINQFDPTFPFSESSQCEFFIQIFKFSSNFDVGYWKNLEKTKSTWREITKIREKLMGQQEQVQQQIISQDLLSVISKTYNEEKAQIQREKDRINKQKQMEYEYKQQQERQKIIEEEMFNQAEQQPEYNHMIDKPMKNSPKHKNDKKPMKHMQLSAISPRSSMGTDEDSEEDDNSYSFGQATFLSHKQTRNTYIQAAKKLATGTRVLPKIGVGKVQGALIGTLKIMPQSINSKCEENYVICKNLQQEAVKVFLDYNKDLLQLQISEVLIQPFQSVTFIVKHLKVGQSFIKFKSITEVHGEVLEDQQIVEVR